MYEAEDVKTTEYSDKNESTKMLQWSAVAFLCTKKRHTSIYTITNKTKGKIPITSFFKGQIEKKRRSWELTNFTPHSKAKKTFQPNPQPPASM